MVLYRANIYIEQVYEIKIYNKMRMNDHANEMTEQIKRLLLLIQQYNERFMQQPFFQVNQQKFKKKDWHWLIIVRNKPRTTFRLLVQVGGHQIDRNGHRI